MESLRSFLDALEAFGSRLAAVQFELLAAALALSLLNLALRSRGWQNILRAALPGQRLRYRTAFGAYCSGVGVNAIIPARAGDLVKLFLIRRSLPSAGYPTIAATLVAETLFDAVVATALLVWALESGVLPGLRLPEIPAFDLAWAFANPLIAGAILLALLVAVALAVRRVRAFWRRFRQGLVILTTPVRYLRSVVGYQALGWCCRVGAAYLFLEAFNLPASFELALTVQVAYSLGGLFPVTPGGLGPKQALLVVMLAGAAGRTDVLAFSAGMDLSLLAMNLTLAAICLALMLKSLRLGRALGQARAGPDAAP